MAPKRKSAAPKASEPEKVARTEPDDFTEDVEAVLAMLDEAGGPPEGCRAALRAGIPHCLRTVREERHEYQASLIEGLVGLLAGMESARSTAVDELEAQQSSIKTDEGATTTKLEDAKAFAASCLAEVEAARKARQTTIEASDEATQAVVAAQKHLKALDGETKGIQERKAEIENALAECWEPLEGSKFAGVEWRKRDKAAARIEQLLREFGAGEALALGAAASLKTKAAARGSFAAVALEHGRAAFTSQLEELGTKLAGVDAEAQKRASTLAAAEEGVTAAEKVVSDATDATIAADNRWAQAETVAQEQKDLLASFGPKAAGLSKQLGAAKAAFTAAQGVVAKLASLRDRSKPAPAEAPAPEEPAGGESAA